MEMIDKLLNSAQTVVFRFLGCCFSKIIPALYDANFYWFLLFHTSFCDGLISRLYCCYKNYCGKLYSWYSLIQSKFTWQVVFCVWSYPVKISLSFLCLSLTYTGKSVLHTTFSDNMCSKEIVRTDLILLSSQLQGPLKSHDWVLLTLLKQSLMEASFFLSEKVRRPWLQPYTWEHRTKDETTQHFWWRHKEDFDWQPSNLACFHEVIIVLILQFAGNMLYKNKNCRNTIYFVEWS